MSASAFGDPWIASDDPGPGWDGRCPDCGEHFARCECAYRAEVERDELDALESVAAVECRVCGRMAGASVWTDGRSEVVRCAACGCEWEE